VICDQHKYRVRKEGGREGGREGGKGATYLLVHEVDVVVVLGDEIT